MKFLYALVLLTNVAMAEDVLDWNEGFIVKADGKVAIDTKKFSTFNSTSEPAEYTRKVKYEGKESTESYYVYHDSKKNIARVTYYTGLFDKTDVWTFTGGKVESETECYGTDCKTVSRKLCKSLMDYYKTPEADFKAINKKHEECTNFYNDIYEKAIEPHLDEISKYEETNLKDVSYAFLNKSLWKTPKVFSVQLKDANHNKETIRKLYTEAYSSASSFKNEMIEIIMKCDDFVEPKKVAAAPVKKAPAKTTKQ